MKVKRVLATPELITEMLTTGYQLTGELSIADGLPAGAQLVGVAYSLERRAWGFDFYSELFEWVPEGKEPPILQIVVQKKHEKLSDALSV